MRIAAASKLIAFSLAALVGAAALPGAQLNAAENNPVRTRPDAGADKVSQRFIVKMRGSSDSALLQVQAAKTEDGVNTAAVNSLTQRAQALASRTQMSLKWNRPLSPNMQAIEAVSSAAGEGPADLLTRIQADSDVEYAVVDRRVYLHATPNDPRFVGQWYLQNDTVTPSAIDATTAWDTTTGSANVVIAVVDTGVRFEHEDLKSVSASGKLLPGYDFVSEDSAGNFKTANDGDGRDSDASDPGDWVTTNDGCGSASNSSWHGTRVSGIIGALSNNGVGVTGVSWKSRILPVRVIGKCGGFNSDVIAGMRWAAGLSVPGVAANTTPAKIINLSLGGEGTCDSASAQAVSEVTAAGALVVVSAGNEGGPVDSPANCTGAVGVAGLRHAGTKVGYSSLGPEIAVSAPAGNCVTDTACTYSIDTTVNTGTTTPVADSYTDKTNGNRNIGTSFSAPIVSGIAGLMLSVNSNLKPAHLLARLKEGAKKPFPTTSETGTPPVCHVPVSSNDVQGSECSCTTSVCGAGMANAPGSVTAALRPISTITPPASVTAGSTITLQGASSTAADTHTIASYSWSKGGLVISSSSSADVTVPTSGSATVCLTVTDDAGKQDTSKVTITSSSATTSLVDAGTNACQAEVSVTATDATASESGDTGTFTFTRTGDISTAMTATIAMSGSAVNGTDYQSIGTSVTFAAGVSTATLTLTPIDNTVAGSAKSAIVTVQSGTGYTAGSPNSATVTISDNDTAAQTSSSNGGGGGGGAVDPLVLAALALALLAHLARTRRVLGGISERHAHELCQHARREQAAPRR